MHERTRVGAGEATCQFYSVFKSTGELFELEHTNSDFFILRSSKIRQFLPWPSVVISIFHFLQHSLQTSYTATILPSIS